MKAVQYIVGKEAPVLEFLGLKDVHENEVARFKMYNHGLSSLVIKTPEGEKIVGDGDYIIKSEDGTFYPCKKYIFNTRKGVVRCMNNTYFLCIGDKGFKLYPETGKYLLDLCKNGKTLLVTDTPTKDTIIEWNYNDNPTFNGSEVRVCNSYPKYAEIEYGKYYINLI